MSTKGRKQTAYLSAELAERLEKVKDRLNISEICSRALDAAISEIEYADMLTANQTRAMQVLINDPLAASEFRRTGSIPMPISLTNEITSMTPAQRAGTIDAWRMTSEAATQMLAASDRHSLFDYKP